MSQLVAGFSLAFAVCNTREYFRNRELLPMIAAFFSLLSAIVLIIPYGDKAGLLASVTPGLLALDLAALTYGRKSHSTRTVIGLSLLFSSGIIVAFAGIPPRPWVIILPGLAAGAIFLPSGKDKKIITIIAFSYVLMVVSVLTIDPQMADIVMSISVAVHVAVLSFGPDTSAPDLRGSEIARNLLIRGEVSEPPSGAGVVPVVPDPAERARWTEENLRLAQELVKLRETIYRDLHDNLGRHLLDAKLLIETAGDPHTLSTVLLKLREHINFAIAAMRQKVSFASGNTEFLSENPVRVFRNFIEQRYLGDRNIRLFVDPSCEWAIRNHRRNRTRVQILSIFNELINNDLVHGSGEARLHISSEPGIILIHMNSRVAADVSPDIRPPRSLQGRVTELGGRIAVEFQDGYSVFVRLPERLFGEIYMEESEDSHIENKDKESDLS